VGQGHGSAQHHLRQFIESRINDPVIDQGQLATWIYHWAPLDDRAKLEYLLRLQDPNACNYLRNLVGQNEPRQEDVLQQLSEYPNPALDRFLIDACNRHRLPMGPVLLSRSLTYALVRTDTPAIRKFITENWNKADRIQRDMTMYLSVCPWRLPHMNWLVPMIAELTDKSERKMAAKVLSCIDTPDAYALAEKWATEIRADDPMLDICRIAAEQLKIRDQRAAQRQQELTQAADLIAGRIKPDDLLPAPTPYTWNGTEYIPDISPK